jgi:polyisoprenoid-binding protein YceI
MRFRIIPSLLALFLGLTLPVLGEAAPLTFRLLPTYSRVTFKSDAPLETIVGTTAGPAVEGRLTVDPTDPTTTRGTIRVDLSTLRSGVEKRDADMRGKDYLDVEGGEQNRYAVFTLSGVSLSGPLPPGQEREGTAKGVLSIKGRPVETEATVRVTYLTLTPAQLEQQKRFGFTADNLKARAKFGTSFTNHGMQVPQLLFLKVANDLQLEADLTFVRE